MHKNWRFRSCSKLNTDTEKEDTGVDEKEETGVDRMDSSSVKNAKASQH